MIKALSPDGFTTFFLQSSWEVIKVEVLGLFRDFHDYGKISMKPKFYFHCNESERRGKGPLGF